MNENIQASRIEYGDRELGPRDLTGCPMDLFKEWLAGALEAGIYEANAACLCTVDKQGRPDGRTILIKGVEDSGLLFYTNYESRKGRQLEENPYATLVFWWQSLQKQIRVSGPVVRVGPEESDRYFASRPKEACLGAWASKQSTRLESRDELVARWKEAADRFSEVVPRPDYWGGYRLIPERFEFWQGRESRLHDRFEYLRTDSDSWQVQRLMP
ncbi:MAG: pyridoxamine 5'-phosphate oxidase [Vulcanimicrobiota bacterium]